MKVEVDVVGHGAAGGFGNQPQVEGRVRARQLPASGNWAGSNEGKSAWMPLLVPASA